MIKSIPKYIKGLTFTELLMFAFLCGMVYKESGSIQVTALFALVAIVLFFLAGYAVNKVANGESSHQD